MAGVVADASVQNTYSLANRGDKNRKRLTPELVNATSKKSPAPEEPSTAQQNFVLEERQNEEERIS